ncbi:MAG: nucleotidyltransferase domain-containing protein [Firmicutes bacterium]|nr:nucleotidyltransferase domain-containing protein [Bacillota bacterium]
MNDNADREWANKEGEYAALLEKELACIVEKLQQLGAIKVILFGSYARGRADLFTDLDLLVVLDSKLPFVERTARLYGQLVPRVATDILAYTPEEWKAIQERPFIKNALSEGKVLYEETRN